MLDSHEFRRDVPGDVDPLCAPLSAPGFSEDVLRVNPGLVGIVRGAEAFVVDSEAIGWA